MIPGLALVLLVVSAVTAGRWGRAGALVLAMASVLWLCVDHPVEGRILWVVDATHGLTAADLAGLAGLVLAAVCWWRPPS